MNGLAFIGERRLFPQDVGELSWTLETAQIAHNRKHQLPSGGEAVTESPESSLATTIIVASFLWELSGEHHV